MAALNPLSYLGRSWSLWPPDRPNGSLKIVEGAEKMSAHIISVLLLRPGEDLMHPEMPMAPDLFDPLSGYNAYYWVYHAEQKIRKYVVGIDQLNINILENTDFGIPDPDNRLMANIEFSALNSDVNALTFGWHEYQGMLRSSTNAESFYDSIYLNSNKMRRFDGLNR